jgi:AmmeMemoRadiSam system protein A
VLNKDQRKKLLAIARQAIESFVRDGKRAHFKEEDPALNEPCGAFVTLHEGGELRGCIGNMTANAPLYETAAEMAVEAATGDPRFPPISPDEIGLMDIEISVLSPLRRVSNYKDVRIPGDGVLIRKGLRSGVYLPQVADETGWGRDEFLTSLAAHKAGLPPDAWKDPATEIYVFTAEVFGEKEGTDSI